MKTNLLIQSAALTLLAANCGAQVNVTLTNPVQTYVGGTQTLTFGGSIVYTSPPTQAFTYTINQDNVQVDVSNGLNVSSIAKTDAFSAALPITLDQANSFTYANADLFSLTIPNGFSFAPYQNFIGDFTVSNSSIPEDDSTTFEVVSGVVPEPGLACLLMSGLTSAGIARLRCRSGRGRS